MSTAPSPAASVPFAVTVNDFSLQVATANGSGSQTANNVLLRSLFRMGVPVSGKNLFPSNIQGLPTWFTIRASRHGYIGRKRELDVLVLMNPETAAADAIAAAPGTSVVYERKLAVEKLRDDLRLFPVPFGELASKLPLPPEQAKLRRLLVNMIYVGVLSDLMGIEPVEIEASLRKQLGGKAKAIELNLAALRAGLDYSAATFPEKLPHRVERMDATAGKLIIDGNSASALAASSAAPPSAPGTRSRHPPRSARRSSSSATATGPTRARDTPRPRSSRPRTKSPRSAWSSAPAGRERAPSRRPRAPESRSCRS